MEAEKVNQNKCFIDSRICGLHFQSIHIDAPHPPTSYSHIGSRLYARGYLERMEEKKNVLSISQNNICLPARAFKTINEIRERTKATVPLLPPSVSFSLSPPPPLPPLPPILFGLICQYNADIQRFVCTSSPEGTLGTKPPRADRQRSRTEARPDKQK